MFANSGKKFSFFSSKIKFHYWRNFSNRYIVELNQSPVNKLGHVTSSYYSPNLKKSIALAVVRSGKNMMGKKLFIPMEDKTINVTVANPVFFDSENKRLNA